MTLQCWREKALRRDEAPQRSEETVSVKQPEVCGDLTEAVCLSLGSAGARWGHELPCGDLPSRGREGEDGYRKEGSASVTVRSHSQYVACCMDLSPAFYRTTRKSHSI